VKTYRTARYFDGKKYLFVNREFYKREIDRQAKNLRKRGHLARITYSPTLGYELWSRTKS